MLEKTKPYLRKSLDIIYPPQCLSCRKPVGEPGNLCSDCWEDISFITAPQCNQCGEPFELEATEGLLCGACIASPPAFEKARAVFKYDDASSDLITSFKYGDKTYGSDYFARWMLRVSRELIEESDIIVPVPLHRFRLFMRRYNQSALLANSLASRCKLPTFNDMLIRKKNTPPQASLLFRQRIINVRGAFEFNTKYKNIIAGKNILLIDDVMTTGATIQACAKRLTKAGASVVNVLTIARTVKG